MPDQPSPVTGLTAAQRHRMCTSKKGFAREGAAIAYAIHCEQKGSIPEARVYICPICTQYHVGRRPRDAAVLAGGNYGPR